MQTFTLVVLPINDDPVLAEIPDMIINEEEIFQYILEASDIDDDDLLFVVTSNNNSSVVINDNQLSLIPANNFNGNIDVEVTAYDNSSSDTQSFILEVLPVNDPPELSFIASETINEDTDLEINLSANDIDGDNLTYSASVDANADISINENILIVSPEDNYYGDISVTVNVSDGELFDVQTFTLVVLPINDDPFVINIIDDIEVLEGNDEIIINLSDVFYDLENGDELSYTAYESIQALEIYILEDDLYLNFNEQQFGSGEVIVTASDNISRAVASTSFFINILEQNDPPEVSDLSLDLDEDGNIIFSIIAYDIENDELTYEISEVPIHGDILSISSALYEYTPIDNYYGNDTLSITISDGINSVVSEVSLNIVSINDDPIFETLEISEAIENIEYEQEILVSDIDNDSDELFLSIISAPTWLEVDGLSLNGTPSFNDDGEFNIILELSDGISSSSINYELIVVNQNQAPIVSDIDLTTFEETEILFELNGVDAENDDLFFTYSEPENGELSEVGSNFSYIPNIDFYGEDSFIYSANDGSNDSNIGVVRIQVININDAPEAESIDLDVYEDPFNFSLDDYLYDADIPDDQYLTFVSVPPSDSSNIFQTMFGGTIIHDGEYDFSYSLPEVVTPSDFLLYKVSDGMAESEIQILTFNLFGRTWPRNSPPSAFSDNVNLEEDNSIDLTLVGFDVYYPFPQDGTESINIISSPSNGSLIGQAELQESDLESLAQWKIEYRPNDNYSGLDSIIYEVDNPNNEFGESSQAIIYINVNEVNDIPELTYIPDLQVLEDSDENVLLDYSDVDSDLLVSAVSSNDNIIVEINNELESLVINPLDNYYGPGYITVTISEVGGDEISVSQTFNIDVLPVNDSPILSSIDDQTINEDESLLLSLSATDIDYVSYEFEVIENENLIININNNLVEISGVENYYGDEVVTVIVLDNEGASDSQTFNLSILPINDPPILNGVDVPVILEDESYILSLEVIDPDDSDFSYSIMEVDDISFTLGESISTNTGEIQWLTISPDSNWYGSRTTIINISDGEYIDSQQIIINVESVNDAPVINSIDSQVVIEDESVDVFINGEDIDGDELIYSISSEGYYSTNIIGNTLSISPNENYNGEVELTVNVSDGVLNSETSFTLDVLPANDPPSIEPIPDLEINEGSSLTYTLSSNDIDGDELSYSIIDINNGASGSFDGDIMIINPLNATWDGEINITIGVNDGEYSDFSSFILSVINVNEPPVAESQNIETNEDNSITITLGASDPDGDNLIFEIVDNPIHGTISQNNNIIIYTPDFNYFGEDYLTFFANDGEYISNTETINININSVNDPPQLGFIEDQIINEGESLTYQLDIQDDNHEDIEIELTSNEDIDFNISEGYILTLSTIDSDFYGILDINIQVSDNEYSIVNVLTIMVNPINDSPYLEPIEDIVINEDETLTYLVVAMDSDNDNLIYGAQSITNGTIEFNNNLLTFVPELNFSGNIEVSVYVSDGEYTDLETFSIFINPINDPPTLSEIGNQIIDEDTEFNYFIDVSDPEDDIISYSVEADTTNAIINLENNILSIIPNLNWYGEIIVSVNINDGEYNDFESFILQVNSVNDIPVITSDPVLEAYEDIEYIYEVNVDDPDDNSFEYILINNPEGMTISNDGIISWTPTEGVISSGLVGVVVWDTYPPETYDIPAYQEFIVNVIPINDPPVIVSVAPSSAIEDIIYEYNVEVEDPDNDSFTLSLVNGPEDMEIIDGRLRWLPLEGVVSSGIVTISVNDEDSDNPLTDTQDFMITVTPVNDPPLITSTPDTLAYVGELYEYQIIVEDPDDDSFTYMLTNYPEEMGVDELGLIQWIPASAGVFGPITIEVFDGGEDGVESAQQLFIIVAEHISPLITMEFDFDQTTNLISFLGIPEDSTISSIFEPLGDNALAIIGEGEASQHLPNDLWVGSLQSISPTSGYWLKLDQPEGELVIEAYPTDPEIIYNLGQGQNLVSYVGNDNLIIQDAIGDEFEDSFLTIIGQGQAAQKLPNGLWVGSLTHLNTLKGYWIKISEDIDFHWNYNDELIRTGYNYQKAKEYIDFMEFNYNQSTQQAFYFFENITIEGQSLSYDDWIIAYNGDQVVGYSKYSGKFTDVPTMGYDGYPNTFGYCENGEAPSFKVFRESTHELIDMVYDSDSFEWGNNEVLNIELLSEYILPQEHKLLDAYPNPFNPTTLLSFEISNNAHAKLDIYNINGQLVDTIIDGEYTAGYYSFNWNASKYSSGVYFVRLNINDNYHQTKKIILIK